MPLPTRRPLRALRAGDPEALTDCYHEFGPMVLSVARRLTGSRTDAEDVLHDVFLGLPEALGSYEGRGELASWLRTVTVRTALMHLRRASRRAEVPIDDSLRARGSAEFATIARLDLDAAIARLPERLRVVFVLKVVEGYSHDEISRLLDIRRGASEMRLTRAIRHLRPFLEAFR